MNEGEIGFRGISVQELEFTRRIEDILYRISSLDRTQRPVKRLKRKNEGKCLSAFGAVLPVLHITKTPVPFMGRASGERKVKPLVSLVGGNKGRRFSQGECLGFGCGKSVVFSDRRRRKRKEEGEGVDDGDKDKYKDKYKRILMLTQTMISKDNLRGWSRN